MVAKSINSSTLWYKCSHINISPPIYSHRITIFYVLRQILLITYWNSTTGFSVTDLFTMSKKYYSQKSHHYEKLFL